MPHGVPLGLACICLAATLMGCAAPRSDGSVWVARGVERELAYSRLTEQERAVAARAVELRLADELLSRERARLETGLAACPSPTRAPLEVASGGVRTRDAIRVRALDDRARLAQVASLALADWYARRADASGHSGFCDRARAALTAPASQQAADRVAEGLSTVAREGARDDRGRLVEGETQLRAFTLYALGWADAVRAPAPVPQHLAAAYGGAVLDPAPVRIPPALAETPVEEVVDAIAPEMPDWEPDAIRYAILAAR